MKLFEIKVSVATVKLNITSLLALLAIITLPVGAYAQTGHSIALKFNEVVHNFGKISIDSGAQKCQFIFTNVSSSPVAISNILSSCGCTTPSWSKAPIKPGDKGVIKVTFLNDQGPYPFDKTLTVYTTSSDKPIILRITGIVYEKGRPLGELFPAKFGPLGMKVHAQDAGQIEQGLYKTQSENIVNLGKSPVSVKFAHPSKGLTISVSPAVLGPGDAGKITYQINTKAAIHWGTTRYTADIICNGKVLRPKFLAECVIVTPYSSLTSEQVENGPEMFAESGTFNFGTAKVFKEIKAIFKAQNKSAKPLRIYKVETNGASIKVDCPAYIPAGKKFTITAIATPLKKKNDEVFIITLITNSPERPLINLFLTGDVK
ncbi:MAG: DUF1573 domain-containing protein [Bacteroidales bacterium]|nr:DUF1573 domain-containing protein [Bacteroidales bacterium]MDD4420288.1 DUF1573 domain-containing protein [Bacteroidales bacterium]